MSKQRDRERRPARSTTPVEPRRRLLVVCEGKVTEPEYLEGFRRYCRNPRIDIRIVGPAGDPFTLVRKAKALQQNAEAAARGENDHNLLYDEVWCVFDVDEHLRLPDAVKFARDNGFRLAVSNPCFELWLLLHLRDHPGPQHRDDVQKMLRELMPTAAPKHVDFNHVVLGYEDAFRRAERLEKEATQCGDAGRNPSTGVFRLTDSIDDVGREKRAAERQKRRDQSKEKAMAAANAALEQAAREEREEREGRELSGEAVALDAKDSTSSTDSVE
ncbi:RloB family protein [Pendulispora albinea]|uniref:RloB family protein n=1 Tax=Pendulispora albinea TaxID=2741071 RepID=A0ABZ2LQU0_9BACT